MTSHLADDELAITITPNPSVPLTLTALAETAAGFADVLKAISTEAGAPHLVWLVRRLTMDDAGAITIVAGAGEAVAR